MFGTISGAADAASSTEGDGALPSLTSTEHAPDSGKTPDEPPDAASDAADETGESQSGASISYDDDAVSSADNSTGAPGLRDDAGIVDDAGFQRTHDTTEVCAGCDASTSDGSASESRCGDSIVADGEACDASFPWCSECQLVPAVTAGLEHTCSLNINGGVRCWGSGTKGQLGTGLYSSQLEPVDVLELSSGVASIAAGGEHTCALLTNGSVRCWGAGGSGQLGNNDTSNSSVPVVVLGLSSGVVAIDAASQHTCALLLDGGIKCWGAGLRGQLGNNATDDQLAPVDVVNLGGPAKSVSLGAGHTCAVLSNGAVQCWGYNVAGQLGNRDSNDVAAPVDVVNPGGIVSTVAAGAHHTCALLTDGRITCWGDGERGALGNGEFSYTRVPVSVMGIGDRVEAVEAGGSHTCVLLTNGAVKCWGFGDSGQLGNGDTESHSTPVNVTGLGSRVSAVAAGTYHTCALLENGGIKCWGNGENGRLGNNDTGNQLTPVDVVGFP